MPQRTSRPGQQYGLFAVLVGAFLEGETVLLLAGPARSPAADLRGRRHRHAERLSATTFFLLDHLGRALPNGGLARRLVPRIDRLLLRWRWRGHRPAIHDGMHGRPC
jgi:hypothetical protein